MMRNLVGLLIFGISLLLLFGNSRAETFSFVFITDLHLGNKTIEEVKADLKNLANGNTVNFLITGGDYDYVNKVKDNMPVKFLDSNNDIYRWFPVVGNHDLVDAANWNGNKSGIINIQNLIEYMKTLMENNKDRNIKNIKKGAENRSNLRGYVYNGEKDGGRYTTYSFDYDNSHFIILDLYSNNDKNGPNYYQWGVMDNALQSWLTKDIVEASENSNIKHIFVFGHEPAFCDEALRKSVFCADHPNLCSGHFKGVRCVMLNYSRVKNILKGKPKVRAYICGHLHAFIKHKAGEEAKIWQICGSQYMVKRINYLKFTVTDGSVLCERYEANKIKNDFYIVGAAAENLRIK